MAHKRIKSSRFPGVYWRETTVPNRKHNGRPDKCYDYCIRVDGKLKWVTVGWASEGYSEQKAANLRREALGKIDKGEPLVTKEVPVELFTLNDAADGYFSWLESEKKHADRERNRYDVHIRGLPLAKKDLALISSDDLVKLKEKLNAGLADSTILKVLSGCRASVYHAIRHKKWLGVNPFGREVLTMPRPQNKGERFLTPEEARILLPALEARSPQLRDMAWLSLKTGLRSAEIFRLTGADVDAAAGVLWVTEKGGRRVAVRVDKEVIETLSSYGRHPGAYIFQSREGNKITQISTTFERVCIDLQLVPATKEERGEQDPRKRVWFHTLRHTFASWLAQSGTVTLLELRDLMRHSSILMTERYAHLIPGKEREKTALIGDILSDVQK
ncbi:site-specific integrase [Desulfovibrio sp. OttesenSCG-928-A18]|nr:site-specific integrase [Desulfovibrio sp. OttesenSCG-928-A18]